MRNHLHSSRSRRASAAFTLVEVLVVIVIIAVLAVFAFMGVKTSMHKADSTRALANIRQSGAIYLIDATENNGRLAYSDPGSGAGSYWLYNRIKPYYPSQKGIVEIMHWNPKKVRLSLPHYTCFGVNYNQLDQFGVRWVSEPLTLPNGTTTNLSVLTIARVTSPESYAFLLDSSQSAGLEFHGIKNSGGYGFPGLRNSGKANAFFLDGSARQLGPKELLKAGFTHAYDNSDPKNTAPKKITLQ